MCTWLCAKGGIVPIKICKYRQLDYTLIVATGKIKIDEILEKMETVYIDELGPTFYILWDLSDAIVEYISDQDYDKIAQYIREKGTKRLGGKTALYTPEKEQYKIALRQIELAGELPINMKAFRYYHDAAVWLTSPRGKIVIPNSKKAKLGK
jgi:hypothetical protein